MESSNVTARHMKQVASDPQVVQINLMWNQHTDLPASKHKMEKSYVKPRPPSHKNDACGKQPIPLYHNKKSFDSKNVYKNKKKCQKWGDSLHVEGFQHPTKSTSTRLAISIDTLLVYVSRRNQFLSSLGNQRPMCCMGE